LNYYERYCGDYAKKTARLSLMEHGAYTLLLDEYYSNEAPLPADFDELFRICRAMKKAEQDAVKNIAEKFFPVAEDGMRHNSRADEMIARARPKMEAARANGAKGGRPKKNPLGYENGNPDETQEKPTGKPTGFPEQNPAETQSETIRARSPAPTPTPCKTLGTKHAPVEPASGRAKPADLSMAMRKHSVSAQPGDPRIIAAAEAGVTVEAVEAACAEAKDAKPGERIKAGYVIAIAERWTREAAAPKPSARASPQPRSYHDDRADTLAKLTGRKAAHEPAPAEAIDVDATEYPRKLG
jgi:uncharacterized protein YdaU (DUF1376 family)